MSVGISIQNAVTHTAIGVVVGATIEGMLPKHDTGASMAQQTFETLVQAGINGALLAMTTRYLSVADPTNGIPFEVALFAAQPQLQLRLQSVASVVRDQVAASVQRMGSRMAEA